MEHLNLLLVEDNEIDIILVKELIKFHFKNIHVSVTLNGQQALDYLNSNDYKTPDLILLDINMPLMNGFEFLQYMKNNKKWSSIPIIMLSSSNYDSDLKKALDLGALAFSSKPLNIEIFKKQLMKLKTIAVEN